MYVITRFYVFKILNGFYEDIDINDEDDTNTLYNDKDVLNAQHVVNSD